MLAKVYLCSLQRKFDPNIAKRNILYHIIMKEPVWIQRADRGQYPSPHFSSGMDMHALSKTVVLKFTFYIQKSELKPLVLKLVITVKPRISKKR